ncbi:semaphorin-4G-like [Pristis pectinata]|uniref:semaphorin-4G-like n=1 Tax=Pristis pectinata TaxID=685728 RepID=UPI00223E8E74|nr:semaphorin-4G-like [Pristis pectinata]
MTVWCVRKSRRLVSSPCLTVPDFNSITQVTMLKVSESGAHLFMALILGVSLCPATHIMGFDNIPRRTTRIQDLLDYKQFSHNVYNYSTFWLEEEQGILYVGAREAIFALNTSDISNSSMKMLQWETKPGKRSDCLNKRGNNEMDCYNYIRFLQRFNGTHLFTCGTYAFHPQCAYIEIRNFIRSAIFEGKERCPYDPTVGYTGLIVDNKIYTATLYGFHGGQADIKRNFQERSFRMDDSVPYSLNEPNFVDSVLLTESVNSSVGDDDKIYLFFTEKLGEENAFNGKPLVSRVARICKSDEGGMRTLQRKWTSFLKTRLVCSIPEYDFHFNILKSIYVLNQEHWQDTIFYGVFVSQWQNVRTSAVCQYTITDIRKAFDGPYKEDQESPRRWSRYTDPVPEPRPGSCITDEFRRAGFMTSRDLPDSVLDFVKKHPLMDEDVRPVGGRPLFTKKHVNYTKIVVDTVTALDDKQYNVMFIGTDDGWIHKVVSSEGSTHIIEEIQLYEEPQPVESLVLARAQGTLFIGSQSGVIQLPVSSCRSYPSCWDCVLARDPYCGWDGWVCRDVRMENDRAGLIQDITNGNKGCLDSNTRITSRRVQKGSDVFLQCQLGSNTAIVRWEFSGREVASSGGTHYWREGSLLVVKDAQVVHSGIYSCRAQENGMSYAVASYNVSVTDSSTASPPSVPERLMSKGQEFIYLILIAVLGAFTFVLSTLSIYLCCSPTKRGNYNVRLPRASLVELQNVSGTCAGRVEEGEAGRYASERFLKIIPGEGATGGNQAAELLPPPPPPPPLPLAPDPAGATPNGLPGLPHVLRKMNGNSYVLLRQASEMESTSPHYHSFTEELSKMLEKRKHAQLVEKLDESSV